MRYKWLVALVISLSFGFNHIIGKLSNPNYTPFALTGVSRGGTFDEAYCYVPSINAVRFDKPLGDWQTWEYRDGPRVQPTLGPYLFGHLAKIIGLENLRLYFPPFGFFSLLLFS